MMKGALTALALIFVTSAAFAADTPMLADRHVKAGVKCESCHGSDQAAKGPRTVKKETCLACHGGTYAKLADRLARSESPRLASGRNRVHEVPPRPPEAGA